MQRVNFRITLLRLANSPGWAIHRWGLQQTPRTHDLWSESCASPAARLQGMGSVRGAGCRAQVENNIGLVKSTVMHPATRRAAMLSRPFDFPLLFGVSGVHIKRLLRIKHSPHCRGCAVSHTASILRPTESPPPPTNHLEIAKYKCCISLTHMATSNTCSVQTCSNRLKLVGACERNDIQLPSTRKYVHTARSNQGTRYCFNSCAFASTLPTCILIYSSKYRPMLRSGQIDNRYRVGRAPLASSRRRYIFVLAARNNDRRPAPGHALCGGHTQCAGR